MSAGNDVWGREVVRREGGGTPFLVYEPRLHNLRDLFACGMRWDTRLHVVDGIWRVTFRDIHDRATRMAVLLRSHGVQPGQRVLLLGRNSASWIVSFWAIVESGGVAVLGNAWWSGEEIHHAVSVTEPVLVLADDDLRSRVPDDVDVMALDGHFDDDESHEVVSPPPPPSSHHEDDPALILFTSGSTGLPKGAVLSHRACIALQHSLLHRTNRLPDQLGADFARDVNLQTGPLFHIGGVQGIVRAWLLGATIVLTGGRFDPAEILRLIEAEGVCRWGAVPTMVGRLLDCPDFARRDVSSLRSLTIGGSAVPQQLIDRVQGQLPNARRGVSQIYGLSEAGGTLTMASARDLGEHPGTVGHPLPIVELRIDAPDSSGVGEIVARSPAQMSGYWAQPDDTTIDPAGWLRTGDLGRVDQHGFLYVTGRTKDVIIRGGENIASAHVETALSSHDAVAETAVVGLLDPDLGEIVGAVVALREGSVQVTSADLARHARDRLAYFEVPTRWWIHPGRLPVTASGKIDKVALVRSFPPAERGVGGARPSREADTMTEVPRS